MGACSRVLITTLQYLSGRTKGWQFFPGPVGEYFWRPRFLRRVRRPSVASSSRMVLLPSVLRRCACYTCRTGLKGINIETKCNHLCRTSGVISNVWVNSVDLCVFTNTLTKEIFSDTVLLQKCPLMASGQKMFPKIRRNYIVQVLGSIFL